MQWSSGGNALLLRRTIIFFLCAWSAVIAHESTPSAPLPTAAATCSSRTVNYITHQLPRQCLRMDRVPQSASQVQGAETPTSAVSANVSPHSDHALETVTSTLGGADENVSIDTELSRSSDAATNVVVVMTFSESSSDLSRAEETDSPLDTAKFLSFEEWKMQNLAKTGQSLDDIAHAAPLHINRQRPGIDALDTLGEEGEISLDFGGFGGAASVSMPGIRPSHPIAPAASSKPASAGSNPRRDAGKTCKERTNYASFDCSATILKSNQESKSASSVLVENKDSYMLNKCSADNKFLIVELCNDIQIDTVVLANYEFFSSSFRHFRVSVSHRYPVKADKWRDLGTFEARNTRDIQAFRIENPLIWAKYLRVEFLSHYGTEYYCPVSLLRVHGTTMIEDFRHEEELARGETDEADEATTLEADVVVATPEVPQEPAEASNPSTVSPPFAHDDSPTEGSSFAQHEISTDEFTRLETSASPVSDAVQDSAASMPSAQAGMDKQMDSEGMTCPRPAATFNASKTTSDPAHGQIRSLQQAVAKSDEHSDVQTTVDAPGVSVNAANETSTSISTSGEETVLESALVTEHITTQNMAQNTSLIDTNATSSLDNAKVSENANVGVANTSVSAATDTSRAATSSPNPAGPQPAQPSTQESFYKSFAKRLQQLESNSTLSLQYIEEQSRILRDAFSKVEKRQVATTSSFLAQLNETVTRELHGFRQAYDQLWQSTVLELETQRESCQRETLVLGARLSLVADELAWQKRLGILQAFLLLLCLALALFGRGSSSFTASYRELPLVQHMVHRSTSALRRSTAAAPTSVDSPPLSPSPESRSPVGLLRRSIWRARTEGSSFTDSEPSRPQSKDGPVPGSSALPHTDEDEDQDEDAIRDRKEEFEQREAGPVPPSSPASPNKKNRKRPKKPAHWPQQGNGSAVLKSPRAV